MTNDILSQVRALKESGELERCTNYREQLLAQFALMVLEQPPTGYITPCDLNCLSAMGESGVIVRDIESEPETGPRYQAIVPVFTLPPVPAMDDVEARAERAADEIWALISAKDARYSILNIEKIITAAMRGEI